jgi:hypothetical protein
MNALLYFPVPSVASQPNMSRAIRGSTFLTDAVTVDFIFPPGVKESLPTALLVNGLSYHNKKHFQLSPLDTKQDTSFNVHVQQHRLNLMSRPPHK